MVRSEPEEKHPAICSGPQPRVEPDGGVGIPWEVLGGWVLVFPLLSQCECPHIVNIQGDNPLPVFLPDNCEDEV